MAQEIARKHMAAFLDYAVLDPRTSMEDLVTACELAYQEGFASVCVRPCDVRHAAWFPVGVSTVIGFPHGSNTLETKVLEAKEAIDQGANEIDAVINFGRARDGCYRYVFQEIAALRKVTPHLKVILETCYLKNEAIVAICKEAGNLGVEFVKTSTGYGEYGAVSNVVELMIRTLRGSKTQVKASGGINSYQIAKKFLALGCMRLGSSKWLELLPEESNEST